ncbi:hypothetical protein KAK07_12885 [Ideonella sp. 4Y16]|uniref:Transmembrane protein n=1 Tax=Ideonella alba TaxID=2824118 RepID=A0A941BEF5_9BURK|nr:hypothetical protein [Ideonella alba]MBQ0931081.1 hypothetical protein [Ideonella alba]MBQ0944232.1 hypothetical protein [Ideonella alba]
MSEPDAVVLDAEREASLRSVSQISYLLHAVVAVGAVIPSFQPGVALLVVAFIIDMVKRGEAQGSWQESHFAWRIRSVVWAGLLYLVTAPLWVLLIVPGWIAWFGISLWFLYRVVRGWSALNDRRPMPR